MTSNGRLPLNMNSMFFLYPVVPDATDIHGHFMISIVMILILVKHVHIENVIVTALRCVELLFHQINNLNFKSKGQI